MLRPKLPNQLPTINGHAHVTRVCAAQHTAQIYITSDVCSCACSGRGAEYSEQQQSCQQSWLMMAEVSHGANVIVVDSRSAVVKLYDKAKLWQL